MSAIRNSFDIPKSDSTIMKVMGSRVAQGWAQRSDCVTSTRQHCNMTDGFDHTPKLVHELASDAPLPASVLASLLIEVHAGLMADTRLSHLAEDIEAVIYEVVAAARLRQGEVGNKVFPPLRLVD
jgi:hypothetical protein